jgi:predicted transcriptional regulator of viral defense system
VTGRSMGRQRLGRVLRECGQLLTPQATGKALGVGASSAAKLLSRWLAQGWLTRIRRGLYASVPLEAGSSDQVLANPWVLVPRVFEPGYVGGWSAAEHWDLTEQLFASVCVITSSPVRSKAVTLQGVQFVVKHVSPAALFGTQPVWEGRTKVQISDPHKTVLDMLDDPALGGGIAHVESCLRSYLSLPTAAPEELLAYADRLGNRAVFKRLGFLLARSSSPNAELLEACARRLSSGYAKLDPALPCPRLATRWRLWIPEGWSTRP